MTLYQWSLHLSPVYHHIIRLYYNYISCVTRTTYIAMWEQYRGNKQAPQPAHAMAERPFAKVYVQLHRVIPEWSWGYVYTKRDSDWESAADRSLHHTINTFAPALTHTHMPGLRRTTWLHFGVDKGSIYASVCVCVCNHPSCNIIRYILTSTGLLGNFLCVRVPCVL